MKRLIKINKIYLLCCFLVFLCLTVVLFCSCKKNTEVKVFAINYLSTEGGYIVGEANQSVKENENSTEITALPYEGYRFKSWSDGNANATRIESSVSKDLTFTAIFEKLTFAVKYLTDGNGTIAGNTEQTIEYGEQAASVTVTANEGYKFVKWSDGVTEDTRTDTVKTDLTVTAIFEKQKYAVKYLTDGNGTIAGNTEQTIEYGEQATRVTVIANEGYKFVKWSDGVIKDTRTDTVKTDLTVTAIFEKQKYAVKYLTDGNGTIAGNTEQTVEYGEQTTSVVAVPYEGYEFIKWSDGYKEMVRTDLSISNNISVAALFKIKIYKVQYFVDGGNGILLGKKVQSIKHGGNGDTVVAIPNEGYSFYSWADGNTNPERTDLTVTGNITMYAFFVRSRFTLTYRHGEGGSIHYLNYNYKVFYGENGASVRAEPRDGYVFIKWSDGITTAERTDNNVKNDIDVTAYFGYSAVYLVNKNQGGTIKGESYQMTFPGGDFTEVEAVPNDGYVFSGWSDLQLQSLRHDINAERQIEHIAYFEPIIKEFNFDYGITIGSPFERGVTLNRNALKRTGYFVPKLDDFKFMGWYADTNYKLKVISEDGIYMLGYYGFTLDTDTLYARWDAPEKDELPVFKILLVIVNEIEATLYPSKIDGDDIAIDVHHIMTSIDREFCSLAPELISKYLNEWMDGIVKFEVDLYFTTQVASEKYFHYTPRVSDAYSFEPTLFPETSSIVINYHSVTSVFGLNDYEGRLANRGVAGTGGKKYANVYLESFYRSALINHIPLQDELSQFKTNEKRANERMCDAFIHEFIHTIEQLYKDDEIINFHRAFYNHLQIKYEPMEAMRLYLLFELEYNGEVCGIPKDFWTDKKDEMLVWLIF